jgi:predicted amidohydrolase YtcJ
MSSSRIDRRTFLAGTGAAAAGALLSGVPGVARAAGKPKPTAAATVIKNGRVWTGNATDAMADAVAIGADGTIMAVGTNNDVTNLVGPSTVVVSAAGGTVISGIQDGHIHAPYVIPYLIYPWLEDAQLTLAQLQSTLSGYLADPNTVYAYDTTGNTWLNVLGWNPIAAPSESQYQPPRAAYLDQVSTTIPIILRGSDGHSCWLNTRALQLSNITSSTPNPPGGVIVHNPDGTPSGVLKDTAQGLAERNILPPSIEVQLPYMEQISAFMASSGITSYMDAFGTEESLQLYSALTADGGNLQRVQVALRIPDDLLGDPSGAYAWATGLAQRYANAGVRFGVVKIFLDGVMEYPAQTASLLAPYTDAQGRPTSNTGNLYVDNPTLAGVVKMFDKNGWQVHMHAIGDRAVRTGLDAVAAARKANPRGKARHTIAHLQLIDPADYPRFAQLNVVPCFQLQWACDDLWTQLPTGNPPGVLYIGEERHTRLYPAKSVLAAGGRLAGGSDWPVDPLTPWNQVATAMDRIGLGGLPSSGAGGTGLPLDPDQALDRATALNMHTKGSAFQLNQEATTGTIEVGKLADIQILDVDASVVAPQRLAVANVLRTFVGGKTTWDATSPGWKATPAKRQQVADAAMRASRDTTGCSCTNA